MPDGSGQFATEQECIDAGCGTGPITWNCTNCVCVPVYDGDPGYPGTYSTQQDCIDSGCQDTTWAYDPQAVPCACYEVNCGDPPGPYATEQECLIDNCTTPSIDEMPIGAIVAYPGAFAATTASSTSDWLLCDGGEFSDTQYPALAIALAAAPGLTPGTHCVPNLTVPVGNTTGIHIEGFDGTDPLTGSSPDFWPQIGSSAIIASHSHTVASHTHDIGHKHGPYGRDNQGAGGTVTEHGVEYPDNYTQYYQNINNATGTNSTSTHDSGVPFKQQDLIPVVGMMSSFNGNIQNTFDGGHCHDDEGWAGSAGLPNRAGHTHGVFRCGAGGSYYNGGTSGINLNGAITDPRIWTAAPSNGFQVVGSDGGAPSPGWDPAYGDSGTGVPYTQIATAECASYNNGWATDDGFKDQHGVVLGSMKRDYHDHTLTDKASGGTALTTDVNNPASAGTVTRPFSVKMNWIIRAL